MVASVQCSSSPEGTSTSEAGGGGGGRRKGQETGTLGTLSAPCELHGCLYFADLHGFASFVRLNSLSLTLENPSLNVLMSCRQSTFLPVKMLHHVASHEILPIHRAPLTTLCALSGLIRKTLFVLLCAKDCILCCAVVSIL